MHSCHFQTLFGDGATVRHIPALAGNVEIEDNLAKIEKFIFYLSTLVLILNFAGLAPDIMKCYWCGEN